ncbi:mCG23537 [Mus musculus]|nr:mCG23537 [Mus musculus]
MKNCVTDEGPASHVSPEVDARMETDANKGLFIPFPNREIKDSLTSICAAQGSGTPAQKLDVFPLGTQMQEATRRETSDLHQEDELRLYPPPQSTVRSPEKMTRDGYRVSFLDTKSSGSSPEKDLIPKPDAYPCTHDASLGKRLDVGDSNQILPCQLPSEVCLDHYGNQYSQTLCLHGSLVKRAQKGKNYREHSIKPSQDKKATTSHPCGDLLTSLSNPDSSTGRLLRLSSDLYATTHFNSDPALLANVEQQLSSLRDFTPAPGSFPSSPALGNSLRTLLLPPGTPENREIPTKSLSLVTWAVCMVYQETTVLRSLPEPPTWPLSSDSSWSWWTSTGMALAPSSWTRSFSVPPETCSCHWWSLHPLSSGGARSLTIRQGKPCAGGRPS